MSKRRVASVGTHEKERAGVKVTYNPAARIVTVSGWFDSVVGIEPCAYDLRQFLLCLGITLEDCRQSLREGV